MARTREERNAARRAQYDENKKRWEACDKFTGEIMRQAMPRIEAYLRQCILEDKPAKLSDIVGAGPFYGP